MSWMDDYEAEVAAKAKAETAAEDARWAALTPEQQAAEVAARAAARDAEAARQDRIAAQHRDMFGDDDEGEEEE